MKKKKPSDPFRELSWDDLKGWAGSTIVSRGRSYQSSGSVSNLAHTKDGGLIRLTVLENMDDQDDDDWDDDEDEEDWEEQDEQDEQDDDEYDDDEEDLAPAQAAQSR